MRARQELFIALLLAGGVHAEPVGMFTDVKDVGVVSRATEASFESNTGTYTIGAGGDNIWAARDAFGFAWKPMSGDTAFAARIEIQGTSAQEHRKAGLMFRQSLEPDSAYVDVVIHGNGLTSLQFRTETGGPTREIQCAREPPNAVRLEKRGDYVLLQLSDIDGKFEPSGCAIKLAFGRVFYAGLAVCAHDKDGFETALFKHVSLGLLPKRSEIRTAAIEIIPIGSLDRRVIYQSQARLDSPSFTPSVFARTIASCTSVSRQMPTRTWWARRMPMSAILRTPSLPHPSSCHMRSKADTRRLSAETPATQNQRGSQRISIRTGHHACRRRVSRWCSFPAAHHRTTENRQWATIYCVSCRSTAANRASWLGSTEGRVRWGPRRGRRMASKSCSSAASRNSAGFGCNWRHGWCRISP
jgi:regulation of enolase protein 1 (concanavalin A-like superfamily)